jgi:hypothetical protein
LPHHINCKNKKETKMLKYILARLSEASTIRGLILFLGSASFITIDTAMTEYIIAGTMALSGVVGILTSDGGKNG